MYDVASIVIKFKQSFIMKKMMISVSWDRRGVILVDFMKPGITIGGEIYQKILTDLRCAIISRTPRLLISEAKTIV